MEMQVVDTLFKELEDINEIQAMFLRLFPCSFAFLARQLEMLGAHSLDDMSAIVTCVVCRCIHEPILSTFFDPEKGILEEEINAIGDNAPKCVQNLVARDDTIVEAALKECQASLTNSFPYRIGSLIQMFRDFDCKPYHESTDKTFSTLMTSPSTTNN